MSFGAQVERQGNADISVVCFFRKEENNNNNNRIKIKKKKQKRECVAGHVWDESRGAAVQFRGGGGKKKKKTMPTTHVGTLLTIIGWQTPFQCGMNPPLNKKF